MKYSTFIKPGRACTSFNQKKKYGNCENCGEPIPVARLEALPYSSLCKNCAALIES